MSDKCAYINCKETNKLNWYYSGSSMVGIKVICCPKHGMEWENQ